MINLFFVVWDKLKGSAVLTLDKRAHGRANGSVIIILPGGVRAI
jgi:hypothetical protein